MTLYTNKTMAARLISSVLGPQPSIPIHRPFLELTGDYTAAAFLAQAMYLAGHLADEDGWFDYTTDQWEADLQISRERLRRCQRLCSDFVTIERRGIPCRNFFSINEKALAAALAELKPEDPASGGSGGGPSGQPEKKKATRQKREQPVAKLRVRQSLASPTAGELKTEAASPSSLLDKKQQQGQNGKGRGEVRTAQAQCLPSATASRLQQGRDDVRRSGPQTQQRTQPSDDVRGPLRGSEAAFQQLLETFNAHRGRLPEAAGLTAARRRSLQVLLEDCDRNLEKAKTQLERATREVAQDDFWFQKRLGFDNLLSGKVAGKAEAWLSRQPQQPSGRIRRFDDVAPPDFGVGARVLYQREGYTVEELTETYAELYDEDNGSVRVLRSSPTWKMLRRLEVAHD